MSTKTFLRLAFTLVLVVVAAVNLPSGFQVTAQNPVTGTWTASLAGNRERLNLNFSRRNEKGGKQNVGQDFALAELGLTRQQVLSGGPIRFTLAREAGTIDCEGSFENSKGSGTFRFTSNPTFVAAMKSRGIDFERDLDSDDVAEDKLFSAAALNITTAAADDLASAGFKLDVKELFKAVIFKVDSKFAHEMNASGFPKLTLEDLVKARIFKIDAEFISQTRQLGFEKQTMEELVKLRIFKVTPEFIAEVRNEGLKDISIEDLVKLRIFKIDSEFIREAKADGVPLEVEKLVQRRIGAGRKPAS